MDESERNRGLALLATAAIAIAGCVGGAYELRWRASVEERGVGTAAAGDGAYLSG
jgi:hypothetical protein